MIELHVECMFGASNFLALINGSNHWVLCQSDQVNRIDPWPGGQKVLFVAASDRLPSHTNKDGRATDICYALIRAHQCGVLMVDAG